MVFACEYHSPKHSMRHHLTLFIHFYIFQWHINNNFILWRIEYNVSLFGLTHAHIKNYESLKAITQSFIHFLKLHQKLLRQLATNHGQCMV